MFLCVIANLHKVVWLHLSEMLHGSSEFDFFNVLKFTCSENLTSNEGVGLGQGSSLDEMSYFS